MLRLFELTIRFVRYRLIKMIDGVIGSMVSRPVIGLSAASNVASGVGASIVLADSEDDADDADTTFETIKGDEMEVDRVMDKGKAKLIDSLPQSEDTEMDDQTNRLRVPNALDISASQLLSPPHRPTQQGSAIASTSQLHQVPSAAASSSTSSSQPLPPPLIPTPLASGSNFVDLPPLEIPAIDENYVSTLPTLPMDILRTRLSAPARVSSSKREREKLSVGANGGPDLWRMHVKAVHTGARNFLGKGSRVHNVLSTKDWVTAQGEVRGIRAFERIEQLKAEKAWSFRQPKKSRAAQVPKAHWDHLLDEMVSAD